MPDGALGRAAGISGTARTVEVYAALAGTGALTSAGMASMRIP